MIAPRLETVLVISLVAAGMFLAKPSPALSAMAQPSLVSSREGVNAVQPVGQRRCYAYRDGRRVYRPCAHGNDRKHKRKPGSYGATQSTGSHRPWGGHEPCANCPTAR